MTTTGLPSILPSRTKRTAAHASFGTCIIDLIRELECRERQDVAGEARINPVHVERRTADQTRFGEGFPHPGIRVRRIDQENHRCRHDVRIQREQGVDIVDCEDAGIVFKAAERCGVPTEVVWMVRVDTGELELGMTNDVAQALESDVPRPPLNDAMDLLMHILMNRVLCRAGDLRGDRLDRASEYRTQPAGVSIS